MVLDNSFLNIADCTTIQVESHNKLYRKERNRKFFYNKV